MSREDLEIGCTVEIHGLVSASEHNGCHGVLVRFDSEKGRWGVRLAKNDEILGVKPANLKFIKAPEVDQEEEEEKLQRAKRRFDQIRKKYGLDSDSKSGEIADLLTGKVGGTEITAQDFAARYGMKADEALDFLLFIKLATEFKQRYMDPHHAAAAELRKNL